MALELTINLPSGIEITNSYCRITSISQYFGDTKICNIEVEFYKDRDARINKLSQLDGIQKFYSIDLTDEEYESGVSRALVYDKLKLLSLFEDSQDV